MCKENVELLGESFPLFDYHLHWSPAISSSPPPSLVFCSCYLICFYKREYFMILCCAFYFLLFQIEQYKAEIKRLQESEAEIKALSVNYAALLKEKEVPDESQWKLYYGFHPFCLSCLMEVSVIGFVCLTSCMEWHLDSIYHNMFFDKLEPSHLTGSNFQIE